MIYVISREGNPLMPTRRNAHVRRLLDQGRATVVALAPFTIRLAYGTEDGVQPVSLGVDAGTAHIGLSACSDKHELFKAEVQLRTDIVDNLATRRAQRRTRRSRLRYRKPRFQNRRASKKQGWLPPSVRNKVEAHKRAVAKVNRILPVSETHVEVGNFDAQRINNPDIKGAEYQQGEQMGFWNVREYVLARDGHECQHCHGRSKDKVLNVHHIESRKTGGDAPNNLVTLCETCHKALHRGEITLKRKRGQSLRDAAAMNAMKERLVDELRETYPNVTRTYGYVTKYHRIEYGVGKSHMNDARIISGQFTAEPIGEGWIMRQVRRHNRQLHKANKQKGGVLRRNQAPWKVNGFRLFDVVRWQGKECFISARRMRGSFSLRDAEGDLVKDGITYKKLYFKWETRGFIVMRNGAIPPPPSKARKGFPGAGLMRN